MLLFPAFFIYIEFKYVFFKRDTDLFDALFVDWQVRGGI